jgi:hypothetical protein
MKGQHKPGYHRPRTGEKRHWRQPLVIDTLPEVARLEIQKRRAKGETWEEISEASEKFAGRRLALSVLHRWYDLRVEQVQRDVMAQAERARSIAAAFAGKQFKDLPEATVNALSSEVFAVSEAGKPAEREAALGRLLFLLTKLMQAQAAEKRVEIEKSRIELARKKFEELRNKAEKVTNDAATKLGKGRALTIDDINRIRERTFGLPPVERGASSAHPA